MKEVYDWRWTFVEHTVTIFDDKRVMEDQSLNPVRDRFSDLRNNRTAETMAQEDGIFEPFVDDEFSDRRNAVGVSDALVGVRPVAGDCRRVSPVSFAL